MKALASRSPTSVASRFLPSINPDFWEQWGERLALASFHETAEKVPAYRDFLLKHGLLDHRQVKTIEDFKEKVPVMHKESYVEHYPLDQRSIQEMQDTVVFTISGGTSAASTLINHSKDEIYSPNYTKLWLYYLLGDYLSKRILFINSFAQGAWSGGVLTTFIYEGLAKDPKLNLSIVTPGLNAELVITIIEAVGKFYDIILLAGYPSFLRFIYYEGVKRKLDWNAHKVVLMCSGESAANLKHFFARNYKINPYFELLNTYGNTEGGWAIFTPLCNLIEGLFEQNPAHFGIDGVASFFQYCPLYVFFEEQDGELLITRDSSATMMPLIRYKISDAVKLWRYAEMENIWQDQFNIEPSETLKNFGFSRGTLKWPFCAVRGRTDQCVFVLGLCVDPDELAYALNIAHDELINSFYFGIEEDVAAGFVIYLELFPGASIPVSDLPEVTKKYHDLVVENLSRINLDFQSAYAAVPMMADPVIRICSYGEGPFKDDYKRLKPKHLFDDNSKDGPRM
jgi:phenylacetate-coenzyme A ligase PaaK-like adenylate-forming protein